MRGGYHHLHDRLAVTTKPGVPKPNKQPQPWLPYIFFFLLQCSKSIFSKYFGIFLHLLSWLLLFSWVRVSGGFRATIGIRWTEKFVHLYCLSLTVILSARVVKKKHHFSCMTPSQPQKWLVQCNVWAVHHFGILFSYVNATVILWHCTQVY